MKPKMLISAECKKMLDEAAYLELSQSHLWRHTANHMQRMGLFGAQKYFLKESDEEMEHYQLIADFLNDVGTVVVMPKVENFTLKFDSLRDAVESAYVTEEEVYKEYKAFYDKEGDPIVKQFLLQFLEFQRNAVGAYGDLLSRLDVAGEDKCAMLIIDKEMGG